VASVFDDLDAVKADFGATEEGTPEAPSKRKVREGDKSTPRGYRATCRTERGEEFLDVRLPWWVVTQASVSKTLALYLFLWRKALEANNWVVNVYPLLLSDLGYTNRQTSQDVIRRLVDLGLVADVRTWHGGTQVRLVSPADCPHEHMKITGDRRMRMAEELRRAGWTVQAPDMEDMHG
jgi:hypothetical protein